jgi:hypothetical protein
MSPVPEKKHGIAGTVREKRRGSWAVVAELPITDSVEEWEDDELKGIWTEVMTICGIR